MPSNATIGRPCWKRTARMRRSVWLPACSTISTFPSANRSSAKSVSGFTITCPLFPCPRATLPINNNSVMAGRPGLQAGRASIPEVDRHLRAVKLRGEVRQRPHCLRGASLPADHAAHVSRRHRQVQEHLAAALALRHLHGVGLVGEALRDRLDDGPCAAAHEAVTAAVTGASDSGATGLRSISVRTVSDATAPSFSQYPTRSRSSCSFSGCVRGL